MAAAAILKFTFWTITWFILHIHPPNLIQSENRVSEQVLPSKFTFAEIQDGGRPPSRNHSNGYMSDILNVFAPNLTQRLKLRFWINFNRQYPYPTKSKIVAVAILKFTFWSIIRSLMHAFATNLIHRLKVES